jgi:plastocyanin
VAAGRRFVAVAALALLVAACGGGTPASTLPVPSGALVLRTVDTKFVPSHLSVEAGQPFVLYFDNADTVPHNVVIVGPDGSRLVVGDILSGSTQEVGEVPALAPGDYQLHCDVHVEMTGTLEVVKSPA